jgi:YggT family protein
MAVLIFAFFQVLSWLVIAHVILSYFMSPYHPIREAIDRIVNPLLAPIRQLLPFMGGLDFSPLILIILLRMLGQVLASFV